MMKKLLVLALVLCVVSFASATTVLNLTGNLLTIEASGNVAYAGESYFLAVAPAGVILDAGTMNYAGGALSAITDMTGADIDLDALVASTIGTAAVRLDLVEFASGAGLILNGVLATYNVTGAGSTIYMLNVDADAIVDSVTVAAIPEPVTVALLGLGGLFIRRRK